MFKKKNRKKRISQKNYFFEGKNKTSKYTGVTWNKNYKSWQAQLAHNKKQYYGRNFDNEEHAAMKVNLLCDKYGIQRKNPTIMLEPDAIQKKVIHSLSIGFNIQIKIVHRRLIFEH